MLQQTLTKLGQGTTEARQDDSGRSEGLAGVVQMKVPTGKAQGTELRPQNLRLHTALLQGRQQTLAGIQLGVAREDDGITHSSAR